MEARVSMIAKTRGIILAGQHVWRDSKFDRLSTRPLLPVANEPLFSYSVRWLIEGGVRAVTISVNSETRALRTALDRMSEAADVVLHEDRAPRGPAGCMADAIAGTEAETVVVADGTSVPAALLAELLERHNSSGAAATVLVHPEPGQPAAAGRFVPGGVYAFARRIVDLVPPRGFHDIKEGLLPRLHRAGERTAAFVAAHASPRPLDPASYLALNEWVIERAVVAEPRAGYRRREDGTLCHETACVAPDAVFVGPVVVGPRAQVMGGVTVVGPTSIGEGSTLATRALVSRSAVWSGCTIGEEAVTDRCIVPDRCVVRPRTRALSQVLEPGPAAPPPQGAARRPKPSFLGPFRGADAVASK
jgi:NDP-sugar pyrophosphorylase family protein